jgi:hypothetical protein
MYTKIWYSVLIYDHDHLTIVKLETLFSHETAIIRQVNIVRQLTMHGDVYTKIWYSV